MHRVDRIIFTTNLPDLHLVELAEMVTSKGCVLCDKGGDTCGRAKVAESSAGPLVAANIYCNNTINPAILPNLPCTSIPQVSATIKSRI